MRAAFRIETWLQPLPAISVHAVEIMTLESAARQHYRMLRNLSKRGTVYALSFVIHIDHE